MRALVIGGGIGGLASAIALRRAGIDATVFEQQADVRRVQVGGGIHMWTNAMLALQRLGLETQIRAAGAVLERTEFRTARGALLGEWPIAEVGRAYGLPDVGVSRQDLHRVLVEAVGEDTVVVGRACTGFVDDGDGVVARFADGSEERGDVLVGADGLRSTIRAQLLGAEPPRHAGYAQWQSLADDVDRMLPPGIERVVFGRGTRAVLHHVGGGRLFWAAIVYGPEGTARPPKSDLLATFREWAPPIAAAIEATPEDAITGFHIYDRPPVPRWGDRRTTLLGDAAHPMTTNLSQGGCQALEDAIVLAGHLRGAHDVPDALRVYEAERRARTSPLVKQSHTIARMGGVTNPVVSRARDAMMRLTLGTVAYRGHRKLVAGTFGGAESSQSGA